MSKPCMIRLRAMGKTQETDFNQQPGRVARHNEGDL